MTNAFIAAVFPGQGSQAVGMLQDIAERFDEIEKIFSKASALLGEELWPLLSNGPSEKLNQTIYAQPILLTAAYAIWCIIQKYHPITFSMLAGHSLGEYTALVCAKVMRFEDALCLVSERGRLMQQAVQFGEGAMAAVIGLDAKRIFQLCKEAVLSKEEVLEPANFNGLNQTVIAGHTTAVLRAVQYAKALGAKRAIVLPVSVPAHCSLMKEAAIGLEKALAPIVLRAPCLPVISNVSGKPYGDCPEAIRQGLLAQLYSPVRWVETIQYCVQNQITQIFECGPGAVLTGLNKRIDSTLQCFSTHDLTTLEKLLETE